MTSAFTTTVVQDIHFNKSARLPVICVTTINVVLFGSWCRKLVFSQDLLGVICTCLVPDYWKFPEQHTGESPVELYATGLALYPFKVKKMFLEMTLSSEMIAF